MSGAYGAAVPAAAAAVRLRVLRELSRAAPSFAGRYSRVQPRLETDSQSIRRFSGSVAAGASPAPPPPSFPAVLASPDLDEQFASSTKTREAVKSPKQAAKEVILSPQATFEAAITAFHNLREQGVKLWEKYYLALAYKASREGRVDEVVAVFDELIADEAAEQVQLPPRASRTWHYQSFERMQLHRFVLWSMLDARNDRRALAFYRRHVHGQPNRLSLFESDALNYLLRMECTAKYAEEEQEGVKARIELLLSTMQQWKFNASYSASHALFRLMLFHADAFVGQPKTAESQDDTTEGEDPRLTTIENVLLHYLDEYPIALRRDSKRTSIAISAAASAGCHSVVRALLVDADHHHTHIDAISFAHAVECADSEEQRMEIVDLYSQANDQKRVYTTRDQDASIINYLLLSAIHDGNFRHMMELLHEMQLHNNKASNKTIEELFHSIGQFRARARESGENEQELLAGCPTIFDLFKKFANVLPRTVHTVSHGIINSLRGGDIQTALGLLRATIWSTDIVLRPEIYAQLLYPLLAGAAGDDNDFDRVEVERFFDTQHPSQRAQLNSLLLNLCESNDDLQTMIVCLDRWQEQGHDKMSRRALDRVLDLTAKQLKRLRNEGEDPAGGFFADGMRLSFYAFLKRFESIIEWDEWSVGNAIVRSATNYLPHDILFLLEESYRRDLALNATAYKVALEVLDAEDEFAGVVDCARRMKTIGLWEPTVDKFPHIRHLVITASRKQYLTSEDERED